MSSTSIEDVSKIIENSIKSSNPRERALKGLYFGRLWYKAGEYSNAVEWIVKYLQKYDRDAQAHRLLGECYEKLLECETALASYKQSLHIKPNQYDLVLHVAELFLNPGPVQNPTKAKVWLDKAMAALPGDSTVFKMKMELLLAQEASPQTLENAILKELKINPNDPSLHVQYVTFMKTQDRIRDAYLYCSTITNIRDSGTVESNYKWCSCVVNTYKDFIGSLKMSATSHEYILIHCLLLEALSRLITLCIAENKQTKAFEKLLLMDQYLLRLTDGNVTNEWRIVVEEMKGQISWHIATLLIHQANVAVPQDLNYLSWREAVKLATFFYSYSLSKPLPTLYSAWAVHCGKSFQKLPIRLHKTASIRLSQCSHMMQLLANKAGDSWKMTVASIEGSESIGYIVFGQLFGQSRDGHSSFLCSGQVLTDNIEVPSLPAMLQYDENAALCQDLKMLVWLGMKWMELESFFDFLPWTVKAFPNLKLTAGASSSSSVLTMDVLDVESFIACCVFTTGKKASLWKDLSNSDEFALICADMPLALCRRLTTELQEKWWECACSISGPSRLSVKGASKLKPVMQRGLQCLRGIGNHGLEIALVVKLAKYFAAKALDMLEKNVGASTVWFAYQRRSALYWALAIPELVRLSEGVTTSQTATKDSLFPTVFSEPSEHEAKSFLSEAYMCQGELAAQEQKNNEALSFYGKATIPQASFCQAHIYKQMYEKLLHSSASETPLVDADRLMELYMKKHRHFLEVTLSRLQQNPDESLHEKTIRLLRSPHVSPPRLSANRSINDSLISGPSKQSTPKMKESSDTALSHLVEKESVTNLVDTITTLTSALSSLQMEMGYLREENRMMRQSSPAATYNNSPHHNAMMGRSNQPFTPPTYYPQDSQRQVATPQRSYIPPNPASYPVLGNNGMPVVTNQMQAQQIPYVDAYHQQQQQRQGQAYYNPNISSPFVQNYAHHSYGDKNALMSNEYRSAGYAKPSSEPSDQDYPGSYSPNVAAVQGYSRSYSPNTAPAIASSNQQSNNVLAATLQSKDTDALQQKFGSMLAELQKPTASNVDNSNREQRLQPSSTSWAESSSHTAQTLPPPVSAVSQQSLIQQLLQDGKGSISTTPVAKKEIKQEPKALLSTPVVAKPEEVQFLHKFVSPKSPGFNMKFQSPEQMDRENQELNALERADADTSQNNDTGPHFDPIIPLPDLVDVKTGEENEDVIFSERCKLYRFVDDQWKERGLGLMKLLKDRTTGKSRLVMRREHVLKLCCNHHVVESTSLSPLASCDRAMTWYAQDFADGEPVHEKLTAKFKTVEIAEQFRDVVNKEASNIPEPELSGVQPPASLGTFASPFTAQQPSKSTTSQLLDTAAAKFKFEMPKPSPIVQLPAVNADKEKDPAKPSPFSNIANALSSFGGSGPTNGGFKFVAPSHSHGDSKESSIYNVDTSPPKESEAAPLELKEHEEDADAGPHFEPIVDLPKLVTLATGEENEEVVFQRRAKLFRYVASEWKERGLGDMKILKHKATGRYRIVMRREQVLKICANHHILSGMRIEPQGAFGKAWIWSATDFSESIDEPVKETFAVKFKTADFAKEFYDKFIEGTNAGNASMGKDPSSPSQTREALHEGTPGTQPADEPVESGLETDHYTKAKTGFSFGADAAPKSGFGEASPFTKDRQQEVGKPSVGNITTDSALQGFNLPPKPKGSWYCPDCFSPNTAGHETCPCCNCSNPNLPSQPKPAETGFNFAFGSTPKFGFGDSGSVRTEESLETEKSTTNFTAVSSKGFNLPPKPKGSWQCPDCFSPNTADHETCPCCNCSNPNLPTQPKPAEPEKKDDKFIMKFGTGMATSQPHSSPFSFGIPQNKPSETETTKEDEVKQHLTLQRAGGSTSAPVKFGFGSSNNNPGGTFFSPNPSLNIFGSNEQSSTPSTGHPPKPRFPIDDDENDDDEDTGTDDEETTDSDESDDYATYSETDDQVEDESQLASTLSHQSPMHRFADQTTEEFRSLKASTNDDVICVGEILPSQELQDKAKQLFLPPHFYNYLEKEDASKDTEKEALPSQSKPVSTGLTTSTSTPVFGSNASVSFAQLAASSSTTGFSFNIKPTDKQSYTWKPDTKPMFSTDPGTSDDHDHTNDSYQDDDGHHIHVDPIVQLPPVELKTGEEGETTLLSRRAKLFRFDTDNANWKERGVGDVMIKHNTSSQTFRILMRREQVLKVCANHLITPDMTLEPTLGSDRAWTWLAVDFADDEEKVEKFAIRFKTEEVAQEFKDQVEECQLLMQKKGDEQNNGQTTDTTVNSLVNKAEKMKSELGFFKDKLSMKTKVDLENTFTEDLGQTEPQLPSSNVPLTPLVKQHEMDKEKKQRESRIPRLVGSKNGKEKTPESTKEPVKTSLELNKFAFTMKEARKPSEIPVRPTQQRNISVCSTTSEDSQVDNIHFEPIIPLPEKVVVQTGEENEQALFEERAKVYVFHRDDRAWKERGLGKIRILQNLTTFKIRLVMRREQVLKLCLNHNVNADMKFEFKDNTPSVLTWTALDFSDTEKPDGEMLQFALRFKTAEMASGFMACIDEGKQAAEEKRLLEPTPQLNTSGVSEQQGGDSTHQSDVSEVNSPIKSPVKNVKPTFSFANVDSPFGAKSNALANYTFGETPKSHQTAPTKPGKFTFDMSAISFNFGSTSTPAVAPPIVSSTSSLIPTKPVSSKSLFGPAQPVSADGETASSKLPFASFTLNKEPQFKLPPSTLAAAPSENTRKQDTVESFAAKEEEPEANQEEHKDDDDEDIEERKANREEHEDVEEHKANREEDEDVIFVWAATATEDQRRRAADLLLPPTFFLHEDNCNEEDDISEYEDELLEYIDRRDNPQYYHSSNVEEEDEDASHDASEDAARTDCRASSISQESISPGKYTTGIPADASEQAAETDQAETGNLFQNFSGPSGFTFSAMAASTSNKHAFGERKDAAFNVSEASKVVFSGREDETDPEAYNPHYKPVLSEPPPLIEVKTGEENEEILFKERCKLFRFDVDAKAWKERGLGDLKILHHPERGWYRVVMRREQIFKLCANHRIHKHMTLRENGEKAWSYAAQDINEDGEVVQEMLSVRFKNPQIAAQFKEVWETAQSNTP